MRSEDYIRLRHMLDAASEAADSFSEKDRESSGKDRMLLLAAVKELEHGKGMVVCSHFARDSH